MKLADLYLFLRTDINKIEKELERSVKSEQSLLNEASLHLLRAGGKRIRPVFVMLSGKFGHYDIEKVKHIAVALELIHMASLVHDDVIDDAELRRGKKTIKAKWDNRTAMYTGDYIFAKAVEKAAFYKNKKVHSVLSKAMAEICIGEIEQIRDQFNWDQQLKTYLRRIKRKTASLIAISCQLGAISAGASEENQSHLFRYGYNVGMSYQIIDDILDFIGTEEELGKPAGGDLRQGNVTLPALYAMCQDNSVKRDIHDILQSDQASEENVLDLLEKIKTSGGIEYARKLSKRYLQKAFSALEELPDIPAKSSLEEIAMYIGGRNY
ncbi:heptaprenyl diphosphate synthase component II [Bacillus piscicola]|uniref:heptaprenyl diphosphate synthase component II n=1 Tax=Bacillus piscicola TaxID=1632684 RepID=UPI001F08E8D0|nr:heptaprenyl diphosphate synthase component II [Bacillus piscicola]